jgi:hypothetical protein
VVVKRLSSVFAVGLAAALIVPAAGADPSSDYSAVHADWDSDQVITPCRFTREQLVNARNLSTTDDTYTGFRDAVDAEIRRWDTGGCGGVLGVTQKSANFKIVKVRGKVRRGSKRKEYVTIKNRGGKTGNLKGWSLRDRSGHRIRFRKRLRVRPGRRLRVVTGCAKGHKRAFRRRSRYFACRKKTIWNDSGDVVKLVRPGGKVVSQRGYGRFRSVRRF